MRKIDWEGGNLWTDTTADDITPGGQDGEQLLAFCFLPSAISPSEPPIQRLQITPQTSAEVSPETESRVREKNRPLREQWVGHFHIRDQTLSDWTYF